jgi:hypothetical protein
MITSNTKQWLDGINGIGQRLLNAAEQWPQSTLVDEHCFLIAVNQSRKWANSLVSISPSYQDAVRVFNDGLPDIRILRNQREHGIEHMEGRGHYQSSYTISCEVNNGQLSVEMDASSTIICDEGYLIGGRVNVQAVMAAATQLRAAIP